MNIRIKVKTPIGTEILSLEEESNIGNLIEKVYSKSDKSANIPKEIEIRNGFPFKVVAKHPIDDSLLLNQVGIKSGDQVVFQEVHQNNNNNIISQENINIDNNYINSSNNFGNITNNNENFNNQNPPFVKLAGGEGVLTLRIMEDDNSCLFNAIKYCLKGYFAENNVRMSEINLRNIVADYIRENQNEYNEAVLNKPCNDYINWILKKNSWGGAIEISILAKYFNITINSLDILSGRIDSFNPDQEIAIFIAYSGIHYDAISLCPNEFTLQDDFDITTFSTTDSTFLSQIKTSIYELGKLLKQKNYYTDTANLEAVCKICGTICIGEKGVTQHTLATNHTQYGEK